ncbi:MAG TPA: HTTM domain-containing protein [Gemmataceae bacterium]|nr:HTTM domain-containing protein [Gemmataceae bacterium]
MSPYWSAGGVAALRGKFAEWFGLDLRSLAVFRIGLGLLLLADLVGRAGDLGAHYTDEGVLPRSAITTPRYVSLHMLDGSADFQGALFVLAGLCAVALLVGWWTRTATAASWFLLMSLHARNPMILQGGDTLLRLLLFWGLFLPLGARWSLDARRRGGASPGGAAVSVGSAALVLQLCFVYWFSAALKSDPAWRSEGTAVYYALSLDQFATPLGRSLLGFPGLLRALTFATLALEAVGPALLFVPFQTVRIRLAVVVGFLLFHLVGLRLCLELGPFPWVCAVAWLALLPGRFWDRLASLFRRPQLPADPLPSASRLLNVLAASFLVYVFLWNLRTTDSRLWGRVLPARAGFIATTFGIDQEWNMFAPCPLKDGGWHVVQGDRPDGSVVDLLRDGAPVCWEQPELVSATYPNERWRKYLINLWARDNVAHRPLYARYLLRQWNARHKGQLAIDSVEVYFMLKRTLPDYQESRPEKVLLCAETAFGDASAKRHHE